MVLIVLLTLPLVVSCSFKISPAQPSLLVFCWLASNAAVLCGIATIPGEYYHGNVTILPMASQANRTAVAR